MFGATAVFSIGLVNGASPAANSPFFEGSGIWRDGKTSLGDSLLVLFFAERDFASAWTMPFLFRFAAGEAGGLSSGIKQS